MKAKNVDIDTTAIAIDSVSEILSGSSYVKSNEVSFTVLEKAPILEKVPNAVIIDKSKEKSNIVEEKFVKGLVAYSVPSEMSVGENYSIKIRITKDTLEKKTLIVGDKEIPINDTTVHSTITVESIRVSSIMSAALTSDSDDNFKIVSKSTETQNIENFGYTEWQWNVTPLKSGNHFLKLIIKVRITSDEGSFFKDIVVFEKQVSIKSNASYSISKVIEKYWQWSLSTLIIPFFIWLYNRKKKKKEETNPKDPS